MASMAAESILTHLGPIPSQRSLAHQNGGVEGLPGGESKGASGEPLGSPPTIGRDPSGDTPSGTDQRLAPDAPPPLAWAVRAGGGT